MTRSVPFAAAVVLAGMALAACAPATPPRGTDVPAESTASVPECRPPATGAAGPLRPAAESEPLATTQRDLAMKVLAIGLFGEPALRYGYAGDPGDGRGLRVGAATFATATGDALEVLRTYERLVRRAGSPAGPVDRLRAFDRFVPVLARLDSLPPGDPRRASIAGLAGFDGAWAAAAADSLFRAAQDTVMEARYVGPALRLASAAGLEGSLSKAVLIDALVQHGGGDDPDGLPAMLGTILAARGRPASVAEEREWLASFLELRRAVLECAHDVAARAAWRESVVRVDVHRQLLATGNMALAAPLVFQLEGEEWVIFP